MQAPAWARNVTVAAVAPSPSTYLNPVSVAADASGNTYVLAPRHVGAGAQALPLPATLMPGLYLATLRTASGTATQRLLVE